jgi:hypothetical protein
MIAPHFPSYIAATVSKQIHVGTMICDTKSVSVMKHGTTAKTEVALYAAHCFQYYHVAANF